MNNGLQCSSRTIWNSLRIHLYLAFQNAENDCFAVSAPASFASKRCATSCDIQRPLQNLKVGIQALSTAICNALSCDLHFKVNAANESKRNTGQFRAVLVVVLVNFREEYLMSCLNFASLTQNGNSIYFFTFISVS